MTTAAPTTTNPLYRFRKPAKLAKRSGVSHFYTTRDEVSNDQGMTNVYPGDFTYLKDPTLEIDIAIWEEAQHPESVKMYYKATGQDGYQPALFKDFKIADRLSLFWKEDESKRISFPISATSKLVVLWRTADLAEAADARRLKVSDLVSMTPEEIAEKMQADMSEKFGQAGIDAKVKARVLDDDDDSDEKPERTSRRKRR